MRDLIEIVAAHPWASLGIAAFAYFGIEAVGIEVARVVRAARGE